MEDADILAIAGLIHQRWAEAFDTLRDVTNESSDGSPDWHLFHADRQIAAVADEKLWNELKQRYLAENKATFEKMWA